jgi:titin
VAWANAGGSLTQVLAGENLGLNTTYILAVNVGARAGDAFGPVINLYAGGTLLGTATGAIPAAGQWARWTLVYDSGSANAAAGQTLEISLASTTTQTSFDAVSLTAASDNPWVALSYSLSTGDVTSWDLYRGTTPGGETLITGGDRRSFWTCTDGPLTSGTTYYYKVSMSSQLVTSALSNEISVTPPPASPTILTAIGTASGSSGSVKLTWAGPSGGTSFKVYRGTTSGGESTTPIATGITGATYTDTGLSATTTYFYEVAAVNAGGTSALSAEMSAIP